MEFEIFADYQLIPQVKTIIINDFNQGVETYASGQAVKVDIQPLTTELIQETYGKDIDGMYIVYSSKKFVNGSECKIPDYDAKLYRISNELIWKGMMGDYFIYTLKEVE